MLLLNFSHFRKTCIANLSSGLQVRTPNKEIRDSKRVLLTPRGTHVKDTEESTFHCAQRLIKEKIEDVNKCRQSGGIIQNIYVDVTLQVKKPTPHTKHKKFKF
jgi:hypothetical protein